MNQDEIDRIADTKGGQYWVPTPAEIQQRAAEIRQSWSDEQRESRMRFRSNGEYHKPSVEPLAAEQLADRLARLRQKLAKENQWHQ